MSIHEPDPDGPIFFDAAVLKPGDKVLLATPRTLTQQEMDETLAVLQRNFPGVSFVVAVEFSMSRGEAKIGGSTT